MESSANISECGKYRYSLTRKWDTALPEICFIMLNPSTADAKLDDPTIRRCIGFAKSWSYGRLDVVNLFALRATDPRELRQAQDPVGPLNDTHILVRAGFAQTVICAWGSHCEITYRAPEVLNLLRIEGIKYHALRLNKDGSPAHPLYLPAGLTPIAMP